MVERRTRQDHALRLWIQIVRFANGLQKDVDTKLRKSHGQSLTRFDVLSQLERVPDHRLSVGQLSSRLLTSATNITRLLDRMEGDGLLVRKLSKTDRRSFVVCGTPKGIQLFQEMAAANSDWVNQAFESISDENMVLLESTLHSISNN